MSALQALFAADLRDDLSQKNIEGLLEAHAAALPQNDDDHAFSKALVRGISVKREEIDRVIERAAPQWPLGKIALIDRNILRIGLYELLFGDELSVPPKVALNEAIELAKTFGSDASGRFINGVLGSVYRELGSPRKDEAPKTEKEYFAGIVVCALERGSVYVALVKDAFGKWTLPKTQYVSGELSDKAALRAAAESLGLSEVTLAAPLGEHEYEAHEPGAGKVARRVLYFLACSKKMALRVGEGKSALSAEWFTEDTLLTLDMYADLRDIIESGIVASKRHCV